MAATIDQWKAFREELSQKLEEERRFIANLSSSPSASSLKTALFRHEERSGPP
ncbi:MULTISPECIES: hypothetical protein [unclassified Mesorhizobium]|uniref:hypothetical protein n=1 Tax=unclassified Mesorhizobium TaxID=325217 RepID=UPI00333A256C